MDDLDKAYKSIGELVVVFQWVENKYREIGWFILDPERKQWPPMELRKETTHDLMKKVLKLFSDLVENSSFPNGEEKLKEFKRVTDAFQDFRKFRNRMLHSAYIEMKAGGEIAGLIRANPQISVDEETGELIQDQEAFSEKVVHEKLAETGEAAIALGQIYIQLIHWHGTKFWGGRNSNS